MDIQPGRTATAEVMVGADNFACMVGSGSLEVFATPMLVALVERAAVACLEGMLEPGRTTVGTRVEITHTAASVAGARVVAAATVSRVEGRQIEFEVVVRDDAGEVARGAHTRVMVDEERFMEKARGRFRPAPGSR